MSMVTMKTEANFHVIGFSHKLVKVPIRLYNYLFFETHVESRQKCRKSGIVRFLKDQTNTNMLCSLNPAKILIFLT